jgi:hypothetical protein
LALFWQHPDEVIAAGNCSFELILERGEPSRSFATSIEGGAAITEVKTLYGNYM